MNKTPILTIITPVFNDWESFVLLLQRIDEVMADKNLEVQVLAVNDGSFADFHMDKEWRHISRIQKINLIRNMGHQRAIALGLSYCWKEGISDYIVVMDADGEDKPEDIALLIDSSVKNPSHIIFAKRVKRSENYLFKLGYYTYKALYRLLTGTSISFGNFCLIPKKLLDNVVHHSEIWNHFSAGINRSRLPLSIVSTERGKRYTGESKMNLVSLLLHGLSAISVCTDIVAARLLSFTFCLIALGFLGLLAVVGVKFFSDLAIPGWATYVAIGLFTIIIQAFIMALILVFLVLQYRTQVSFIPALNFEPFIKSTEMIFEKR
jgi:glycosyltransferase involved in cell wall biosynthesis